MFGAKISTFFQFWAIAYFKGFENNNSCNLGQGTKMIARSFEIKHIPTFRFEFVYIQYMYIYNIARRIMRRLKF